MAGAAAAKQKMAPGSLLLKNAARVAHGSAIFVYNHIRTNQVVYSLSKVLDKNTIKQLPYLGKKTVPPVIRKDVWQPLAAISFPSPPQGLIAYQKLREFKMLHELSYPLDLIRDEKTGQLLGKKKRAKKIMDQKATAVADIAAVLKLQEEAAEAAKEEEAAVETERERRAAEAAKAQEEAAQIAKEHGEFSEEAKTATEKAGKSALAARRAEAQAKIYEDAKRIQKVEEAEEAQIQAARAKAERAIAAAEAAAQKIEDEHLRNKAIEAVHALNPKRTIREAAKAAAKVEFSQKTEAEKHSLNAKKAKKIEFNARKRAKTYEEFSAEAENAAAAAQEVEKRSGKEAEETKEAQKVAYRAKKRLEEFQRSMARQEKLDEAARASMEEEAKNLPPPPAKKETKVGAQESRSFAGAADKARKQAETLLAKLYELTSAKSAAEQPSVSKKGLRNHQIRHAQRLQREKAGIEGVKVHWANIVDAEYAENWPPVVTHDVLEWNRHVVAAPELRHPAYEAATERLRVADEQLLMSLAAAEDASAQKPSAHAAA
ncbi:MAG: hypothetical protein M1819_000427 [Sarea resinae]|nr:MAG: hypothetical protein M1819_000427 [Sarea resinae]